MPRIKFQLTHRITGEVVRESDSPELVEGTSWSDSPFYGGGEWSFRDEKGDPFYVWRKVEIPLELVRTNKIQEIKAHAASLITTQYPDYIAIRRQEEIEDGFTQSITDEEWGAYKVGKRAIRQKSNDLEAQVNLATSYKAIQDINWD